MRKNTILIALMACAMVMMGSCSKKVTQQVTSVNQPVLPVEQGTTASPQVAKVENYYQADWNTFKSGGNASVGGTGKEMSSSMQMRMHRGKSIYVSLRPVLGIEVAKMVISGDSILLLEEKRRIDYSKHSDKLSIKLGRIRFDTYSSKFLGKLELKICFSVILFRHYV